MNNKFTGLFAFDPLKLVYFLVKKTILLLLIFKVATVVAQPYGVGHRTINTVDPARSNRSIPLEVYYPADTTADNVPLSSDGLKFPVLAFGHGFVMTWSAYQNIWESVVPHGYIIAFPKTETGFSPSHLEFGKDLAFAVNFLQNEGQNSSSAFYNRTDSASCVMGHSMGGGASFLAVQFSSFITAIANLAPAETNPSAITAAGAITLPALIIAGEKDCVTPPSAHQIPMYNALLSPCKTLVTILGGIHCQMSNPNTLCNLGEASCLPSGTITESQQHAAIERVLIPWLNTTFKNDCAAGVTVDSILTNDTEISVTNACVFCSFPTAISSLSNTVHVRPNPFSDQIIISGMSAQERPELFDVQGRKVVTDAVFSGNEWQVRTGQLQKGMYLLKVGGGIRKLFKQ